MASKTRRNFTEEFKAEAVALLESCGRPLSQVAGELGIEQSVLRSWRRGYDPQPRSRRALVHPLAMAHGRDAAHHG